MPAIRIEISKDLHKRLKMQALQDDTSLQKLVPMALEAWLAKKEHVAQQAQKAQTTQRTLKKSP